MPYTSVWRLLLLLQHAAVPDSSSHWTTAPPRESSSCCCIRNNTKSNVIKPASRLNISCRQPSKGHPTLACRLPRFTGVGLVCCGGGGGSRCRCRCCSGVQERWRQTSSALNSRAERKPEDPHALPSLVRVKRVERLIST
ncbi:hypothetical protein K456DRAFT_1319428 [Colletotrichum gloeosporioides 23]|nr:hypothetical protein K456DRAFT_1319428 [Colletotrichum gloeosporioides 23]